MNPYKTAINGLALAAFGITGVGLKAQEQPNILIILADDMGYSDLGCYGGEIRTPNLDALAGKGIRFTQFYNTSRCCPTRASLLTGLYPHETGVGHLTGRSMGAGYMGYLNDSCTTIAEILSNAGYSTALAGKWHVGNNRDAWPGNRGFQHYYGIHNYVDSYLNVLDQCEVYEDGKMVIPATHMPSADTVTSKEWYTTDVFTDKAIRYIDQAVRQKMPFFQYLAFNSPHWPLEAHNDDIQYYLDKYSAGYETLRKEKFERMMKMRLLNPDWELPEQTTPEWSELSDSVKLDTEFRRAIYAAQVECMDRNIGRLVKHLKDKKILNNTVIIFLSDNGCSAEPEDILFGYSWGKNTRWNYERWRRNSAREGASQGLVWAVTSNSPYQLYKKFNHEGGISTPLIVHWPNGIKNPGRMDSKPGHLIDIMATCLELANASYPALRNQIPVKPMRGISLVPNLMDKKGAEHKAIFWEHEGHGAIRMGNWKLVSKNPGDITNWELYNMKKDRTEVHNLSSDYPELRDKMIGEWTRWAYETNALPWPDKSKGVAAPFDK
jgi:arylsulfatase